MCLARGGAWNRLAYAAAAAAAAGSDWAKWERFGCTREGERERNRITDHIKRRYKGRKKMIERKWDRAMALMYCFLSLPPSSRKAMMGI